MKIRIVRLLPVLDFGGVESRVALQSELMDPSEFDFRMCAFWKPGWAADHIRKLGVPVDILGHDPSVRNPRATIALYHYLRQIRPHVLHASISEAMLHGAVAGALAGVPLRIIEEVGMPERRPLGQLVFSAASRLVHRVIGVSQACCDYLVNEEKMSADQVKLLYNCGKPPFFDGIRRSYEIQDRPFRFFTAGRLVPVKNQTVLLRGLAAIRDQGISAELWIAGEGAERARLEKLTTALGLQNCVRLLGYRQDIRELLEEVDAFMLPSHNEGCSVALVEAMATGIPVIGSTAPGVREVMGDVGEQWLIESHNLEGWVDAMTQMAQLNAKTRTKLGQKASAIAFQRFSPSVYIQSLQSIYREALARSNSPASQPA